MRGTKMLDERRLEEIRARCEAATPGPWAWERHDDPAYDRAQLVAPCESEGCPHANLGDGRFDEAANLYARDCADGCRTVMVAEFDELLAEQDPCDFRPSEADGDFIAHARTDLPDLLADNAALRARVAELEAASARFQEIAHHFRHCRDCGEGPPCHEGERMGEELSAAVVMPPPSA